MFNLRRKFLRKKAVVKHAVKKESYLDVVEKHSAKVPTTYQKDFVTCFDDEGLVGVGVLVASNRVLVTGHDRFCHLRYVKQGKTLAECNLIYEYESKLDNYLIYELNKELNYIHIELGIPDSTFTAIIMAPSTVAESVVNLIIDDSIPRLQFSYPTVSGDCGHGIIDSNKKVLVGLNCGAIVPAGKTKQGASRVALATPFTADFIKKVQAF